MSQPNPITEAKVREIHSATSLASYTHTELRQAGQWIKDRAVGNLDAKLAGRGIAKEVREYVVLMARCHFGSVETDNFLQAMGCYPAWMELRS